MRPVSAFSKMTVCGGIDKMLFPARTSEGMLRFLSKIPACAVGEPFARRTPAVFCGRAETSEGNNSSAIIILLSGMQSVRRCWPVSWHKTSRRKSFKSAMRSIKKRFFVCFKISTLRRIALLNANAAVLPCSIICRVVLASSGSLSKSRWAFKISRVTAFFSSASRFFICSPSTCKARSNVSRSVAGLLAFSSNENVLFLSKNALPQAIPLHAQMPWMFSVNSAVSSVGSETVSGFPNTDSKAAVNWSKIGWAVSLGPYTRNVTESLHCNPSPIKLTILFTSAHWRPLHNSTKYACLAATAANIAAGRACKPLGFFNNNGADSVTSAEVRVSAVAAVFRTLKNGSPVLICSSVRTVIGASAGDVMTSITNGLAAFLVNMFKSNVRSFCPARTVWPFWINSSNPSPCNVTLSNPT